MFLKRIEAHGFKSFAYPTTINFKKGLTVVVGPNGSGKSNINDSIKWVLGETSKKNLRAGSAKDMIFSGSDDEKPADFAEVSLVFDNTKRILNIDFNEVQITRRSYRNQDQNEYLINKELVRRKDVKNLFLDTGLGNTDLSIISQGSVTKITEAKPDDLKELLEEAAGVSRYKTQKEDAVKKLDKTSQNLDIFSVKLDEMEKQIKPLKKQMEKAEEYLVIQKELSEIELPLIKEQLTFGVAEKDRLENLLLETKQNKDNLGNETQVLNDKSRSYQEQIIQLEQDLYSLQSKQTELSQNNNTSSNSSEKEIEKQIKTIAKNISDVKAISEEAREKENEAQHKLVDIRNNENELENNRNKIQYKLNQVEYELNKLLNKKSEYNHATRMILENKDIFKEIHGTVADLISYDSKYETAIHVAIGNKLKNIVVDDEETIKEAIHFLKSNNYGTTTFMPAKKVQPNPIRDDYKNAFNNLKGYIGTLDTVITTKTAFKNVISSVSGNILLFEDIDSALKAAKQSGYKFTITTLEGDVVYPGFTVRGGSQSSKGSNLKDQYVESKKELEIELRTSVEKHNSAKESIEETKQTLSFTSNELIRSQERLNYLESNLQKLLDQYKDITGVAFNLDNIKGTFETSDLSLEQINSNIKSVQDQKSQLSRNVIEIQAEIEEKRTQWEENINKNTEAKLSIDKITRELSINLSILNKDYKLTLEGLMEMEVAPIKIESEKAHEIRNDLREKISKLGFINLESIESYKEISVDYEKLLEQTTDLKSAKDKLLSTIAEMDNLMKDKFEKTFDAVNLKFQEVFTKILGGGKAVLHYVDPENKLDSGLYIEAMTPGKQVQNINLYSGGEKSMIALSLIFAINEVNQLPLLLLDEVEAALDEANVDRFSRFAKKLNEITQLVITTHRPGTMEKADILYGVTMQQRGITKIVSVELAEAIDMSDE